MPAWIINIIITLAVRFGLPWLLKLLPWLPAEAERVIEELLENLKIHRAEKKEVVSAAKEKIKTVCKGDQCQSG